AHLRVREPLTRVRRGDRGGVSQAQEGVGVLRKPGGLLSEDGGVLGHEREAGGDARPPSQRADRLLDERREASCFSAAAASFSLPRLRISAAIRSSGSGSSKRN